MTFNGEIDFYGVTMDTFKQETLNLIHKVISRFESLSLPISAVIVKSAEECSKYFVMANCDGSIGQAVLAAMDIPMGFAVPIHGTMRKLHGSYEVQNMGILHLTCGICLESRLPFRVSSIAAHCNAVFTSLGLLVTTRNILANEVIYVYLCLARVPKGMADAVKMQLFRRLLHKLNSLESKTQGNCFLQNV